jgi:hypothetical protein
MGGRKIKIKSILIFSGLFISLSFVWWNVRPLNALDIDSSTLKNTPSVKIESTDSVLSFTPTSPFNKLVIFYPGAFVEPLAYAPLCKKIADQGTKCVIIKMPFRCAMFGFKKPFELNIFADPEIEYILAGHSHGGEMAAKFVYEYPGLVKKLILLGTRYPKEFSLAELDIKVLKIYGTQDGVETVEAVEENKSKLPINTEYLLIQGANHAQFGYYGSQPFDKPAKISREKQQDIIYNKMIPFINN